ncbi:hypothetical protein CMQ_1143 [Grosmannia clavigera kw1407]|uniref:Uncharacterized protein n=1 Tax=Grosmannia clavigera (strain kw1407 / UAMH 11150) TaxID=655863 RepID=F0XDJ1_GROCL|nr:uncharacterized protein CMQ_1143 [Grosmannia clavigera kw1407]EFX04215.1 hypothetical protein CMQ_1143 [Grosmannia clavigera kw1407]
MKFSIFSTVACMAASVFAAPAVANTGLVAKPDVVKRDILSTLTSALTSAVSEASSISSDVSSLASGSTTSLTKIFEDITGLNKTLTIVVDVIEELNLDAADATITVIDGLLGLFGFSGATQINSLLLSLEAGLKNILEEIKKLGSGSDLFDELETVAQVLGGSEAEGALSDLGGLIQDVITLIGGIPIIGPVLSTLITDLLKSI